MIILTAKSFGLKVAALFLFIILLIGLVSEFLYRYKYVSRLISRKILHIGAISLCAFSPFFIHGMILRRVVIILLPVLILLVFFNFFRDASSNRKAWGIVYFAVAFSILLFLFPSQPEMIFFPLLVLALADGFATVFGTIFGRHTYSLAGERKSVEGSMAFFICAVIGLFAIPSFLPFVNLPFNSIITVLVVSVFLTLLEALSIKNGDNLWIPFALLYWLILDTNFIDIWSLLFLVTIALGVIITFKMHWLTNGGAVAAFLLGTLLIISPGPRWVIPLLFFFIAGSLISFLPNRRERDSVSGRDASQVFYNGGIATLLICGYFISYQFVFLVAALSALAAAISDTAASEIGTRYGKRTYYILSGKRVVPGLSGGVSMVGFIAGFLFSLLYGIVAVCLLDEFDFKIFLILIMAGLAGNVADSLLGAAFQIKYRSRQSGYWSDNPNENGFEEVKGYTWITNGMVNFMTSIFAAIFGFILYKML